MTDSRVIIVTGKGGTGRSAVAAAIALAEAARGQRVLAISMTQSVGLAVHLGATELSYEAHEFAPGVWALGIDRHNALDEYIHIQLRLPSRAPIGAVAKALNGVADTVPGIRDIITIGKVAFEAWNGRWDVVVADGPPTGQISSYLTAPSAISELVPAGTVQRQAERMKELLDAPTTEIVVTTLAEELPVIETLAAIDQLVDRNMDPALVINRLLPALDATGTGDGAIYAAAALHQAVWESQQSWLSQLPMGLHLPFLFGIHTPAEVAARLSEEMLA